MKHTTKKVIAMLMTMLMVLSLAACGGKTDPESGKTNETEVKTSESTATPGEIVSAKDTLVIAEEGDPGTLAPTGATVQSRSTITMQVYESLFRFGYNGEVTPQLATHWEQTDSTHYTVYLREGVKYHDGRDFTAKDVLFTLKLNCEDANTTGVITNLDLDACKIIDDYTIELAFTKADSFNWSKLNQLNIVNEEAYNESGDGMATHPIGTGPYKFESSVPGASYTLTANDEYRDGAPYIKTVTFRIIGEASQRTTALEMGEIDINMVVQNSDYSYLEGLEGFSVGSKAGFTSNSLFFNMTENSPFASKELRQAVCYAVDNAAMNATAYGGLSTPNTGVWSVGMNDYDPTWTSPLYGFDMDAAKSLVESVGAPAETIKIMYGGVSQDEIIAQILQANLSQLGINSEIVSVDAGVLWSNMADPTQWDIGILGTSAPSGYGLDSLTAFLTGLNFQGWQGEQYDKLVEICTAGATSETEEERIAHTKDLWDLVVDEAPLYGIVTINRLYGYNSSLNVEIFDQYSLWCADLYFAE